MRVEKTSKVQPHFLGGFGRWQPSKTLLTLYSILAKKSKEKTAKYKGLWRFFK